MRSRRIVDTTICLLLVVAAMVLAVNVPLWSGVRLIAGLASAVVFVYCAGAVSGTAAAGVAFCGVGVGIAVSGVLVVALVVRRRGGVGRGGGRAVTRRPLL